MNGVYKKRAINAAIRELKEDFTARDITLHLKGKGYTYFSCRSVARRLQTLKNLGELERVGKRKQCWMYSLVGGK